MKMSINSQDKSRLEISRRFLAIISALSRTAFQGKYHKIYELEETHKDHRVQLLGPQKNQIMKKKKKVAG